VNVDAPVQKSQPQSDKKIKNHKDRTTGKYVPDEPLPPSVPVNGPARYCGSIKWIDPKAVELSEQYHTNDREYLSLSRIRACVDIGEGNSTCVVLATPETWKPRDPLIMSIKSGERIYFITIALHPASLGVMVPTIVSREFKLPTAAATPITPTVAPTP